MGADHNKLDALRRFANNRAATPAEKATARRLAKALAAKIGRSSGQNRRNRALALPEPPIARWRRRWIAWIEVVLPKIAGLYGFWIVSAMAPIFLPIFVFIFGGEVVRRQAEGKVGIYLVWTLGLGAAVLATIVIGWLLSFVAWWVKLGAESASDRDSFS
jgi:hypothetical protein